MHALKALKKFLLRLIQFLGHVYTKNVNDTFRVRHLSKNFYKGLEILPLALIKFLRHVCTKNVNDFRSSPLVKVSHKGNYCSGNAPKQAEIFSK